ncbi:hypothetical protein ABDD95_07670 [Mucilaginibacter sp. PAMB04274]|uniref:hypothetical protein n=1 Tax=Mucilaginibacter sp. PAMB04274 TaxID=3138568 RepID=UPI0031F6657D
MKRKPNIQTRRVKIQKENDQWQLHQQFQSFTEALDRLPDAAAVQRNPARSAPPGMVPMVF